MIIGVPKETKDNEYRVGLIPNSVRELTEKNNQVYIESNCGSAIGFSDEDYKKAGAKILKTPEEIFEQAELIIKVKEPQPNECRMLRKNQTLFTYLHLAPDRQQTELLQESGCIAIAYETVTDNQGNLPLLAPMSEVAGRLSVQAGIRCLEKAQGGRGILLGGVPGVLPAKVVVIGGGVVGEQAIRMAIGLEARVTVLDQSLPRLRFLSQQFGNQLNTVYSTKTAVSEHIREADLVIGAVLIPGGSAPQLITRAMLSTMKKRSVLVDVAIDQGGCFETSKPTTHSNPSYLVDEIIHYCVANMPGAVPRTSSLALNHATLPFVQQICHLGPREALKANKHLMHGLNVYLGQITHEAVAKGLNKEYVPAEKVLT